jgi:plastocyanin
VLPRRTYSLALVAAVPIALSGCSGGSHHTAGTATGSVAAHRTSDGTQQVTVDATNMLRFAPMNINAHLGKLRIVLIDRGSYPHNISIAKLHATSQTVSGEPGGQQTTLTVTLTHTGTYDFVCTFHSSAGMKGQLTVT